MSERIKCVREYVRIVKFDVLSCVCFFTHAGMESWKPCVRLYAIYMYIYIYSTHASLSKCQNIAIVVCSCSWQNVRRWLIVLNFTLNMYAYARNCMHFCFAAQYQQNMFIIYTKSYQYMRIFDESICCAVVRPWIEINFNIYISQQCAINWLMFHEHFLVLNGYEKPACELW